MNTTTKASAPARAPTIDQETGEIVEPTNHAVVAHSAATPGQLAQYAMQAGDKDLDRLERLMRLQIEWDAHEAEKAFNEDFARVKAETISIPKNKLVTDGPLKGKRYADLDSVVDGVTVALSKHGFSHSWNVLADDKDWIRIECVLSHRLGHKRSVAFGGAPDTGPGRNAIQSRKSTLTYLERITLLMAAGVAEQNADDDGAGGAKDNPSKADHDAAMRACDDLLASLAHVTTDEAAVQLWNDGKKIMANTGDREAYDKFKLAVATHRTALRDMAAKKAAQGAPQ